MCGWLDSENYSPFTYFDSCIILSCTFASYFLQSLPRLTSSDIKERRKGASSLPWMSHMELGFEGFFQSLNLSILKSLFCLGESLLKCWNIKLLIPMKSSQVNHCDVKNCCNHVFKMWKYSPHRQITTDSDSAQEY